MKTLAHRRRNRRRAFALIAGVLLLAVATQWSETRWRLILSDNASVAGHLFLVYVGQLPRECDAYVTFRRPEYARMFPGDRLLKRIGGCAGDHVTWQGRKVYVNGQFKGIAQRHTPGGLVLRKGPEGTIPPGRYFVWGENPDSLDSRYADIGWVPASRIEGRAELLF